jgi:spore germination protein KC
LNKSVKAEVYQFINDLPCEGTSPVLPAIKLGETAGIKTSELSGTAIFKEDKLIGFVDEEETKYLLFIKDKIKGGLLVLKNCPEANNVNITLEISRNKTRVKPVYSNGEIAINLNTKTQVAIGEQGTEKNYMDENGRMVLEKNAGGLLKTNIENVIQKVQKDFGVDIFGFGSIVNAEMPALWKEIDQDWNTVFKDLKVNVNTTIEIQESGLLERSIKVGG